MCFYNHISLNFCIKSLLKHFGGYSWLSYKVSGKKNKILIFGPMGREKGENVEFFSKNMTFSTIFELYITLEVL